jgi:hypothetical protein
MGVFCYLGVYMTFEIIRKKLIAEMELYPTFGDIRIYRFVLQHVCHGNIELADRFMLSKHVGLTTQELNKVKTQVFRDYRKNQNA